MRAGLTRPRPRPAGYVALVAIGAALGTFWDQMHVQAGTLRYTSPTIADQPWWVPLEFGLAFLAGGVAFMLLGDLAPKRGSPALAGVETAWITAVYAATAFLFERPWILAGVLLLALVVRGGAILDVASSAAIPAAAVVVVGPLAESMLISAGVFDYATSELGPIPVWLPLLWANGAVFMARLTEAILQSFGLRRVVEPATVTVTARDPEPDLDPDAGDAD